MSVIRFTAAVVFCTAAAVMPALPAGDLTPAHVRAIFSARGANPGAVFDADGRRYVLRSLNVEGGARSGEFVVRLRVDELP